MKTESTQQRANRIINQLKLDYPGSACWDVDGKQQHFVAEIEPSKDHPEYDRAVEQIVQSTPHKHLKMTQYYKGLTGNCELHVGNKIIMLKAGDEYVVNPGQPHWARSSDEARVEIYSTPGWTKADHIAIDESH